ncbi:hypothetical protein Q8G38_10575 [Halomonas venusta]|uniref:hypothetical protein n=1 Tax=Vreelandella venusta TaxID=44935 RepID=UPI00295E2B38|nr:hypothetical protein [Halomonas venusta]MDW0359760.1 hypothetical protein [Halomonas venusta]
MAPLPSFFLRSLPIITAATPGAFRIFVITFSMFFIASEEVVAFSTQYTLAAFFVMICGIGFSTILVKGMAKESSVNIFLSYSLSSVVVGGGVSLVALLLVSWFLIISDFFSLFFLVISTSVYQVFRNYLIFKKDFYRLLVNDILIGFLFVACMLGAYVYQDKIDSSAIFTFLSFSYLASLCVVFFWRYYQSYEAPSEGSVALISKDKMVSSLVVGLSNAASGGVTFILPSFFVALGGDEIAIVASIAALVFSSISAVPRGVINNGTAALSKMILAKNFDSQFIFSLRHKVKVIIATLFPSLTLFIFFYLYIFVEINDFLASVVFVVALGFYIATAQFGVVESVMINLCGYERQAFYFNLIVFLGVMMVFMLPNLFPAMQDVSFIVYLLPVLLGGINIFRMLWYRQLVSRYFGIEKSLG